MKPLKPLLSPLSRAEDRSKYEPMPTNLLLQDFRGLVSCGLQLNILRSGIKLRLSSYSKIESDCESDVLMLLRTTRSKSGIMRLVQLAIYSRTVKTRPSDMVRHTYGGEGEEQFNICLINLLPSSDEQQVVK